MLKKTKIVLTVVSLSWSLLAASGLAQGSPDEAVMEVVNGDTGSGVSGSGSRYLGLGSHRLGRGPLPQLRGAWEV